MTEPIVSRERIATEALKASETYADVNDACPYPFGTAAGRLFKEIFTKARDQQDKAAACATTTTTTTQQGSATP